MRRQDRNEEQNRTTRNVWSHVDVTAQRGEWSQSIRDEMQSFQIESYRVEPGVRIIDYDVNPLSDLIGVQPMDGNILDHLYNRTKKKRTVKELLEIWVKSNM